ncbi:MAG: heavy metal-responsive transcriptional regulator [Burkholderiales bacterium]
MHKFTVGLVAKATGVSIDAVRFYERLGLIAARSRTEGGFRVFEPTAVERIRFIQQAKELGFTLREIADLLSLSESPNASCADIRGRAEAKMVEIDERIARLQRIRQVLAALSRACPAKGPVAGCTILDALRSERCQ